MLQRLIAACPRNVCEGPSEPTGPIPRQSTLHNPSARVPMCCGAGREQRAWLNLVCVTNTAVQGASPPFTAKTNRAVKKEEALNKKHATWSREGFFPYSKRSKPIPQNASSWWYGVDSRLSSRIGLPPSERKAPPAFTCLQHYRYR